MKAAKVLIGLFVLTLLAFTAVAQEAAYVPDPEVLDLQMEIRHADISRLHLTLSITADGMIDYITEIEGDTEKLEELKGDFDAKLDDLVDSVTHDELNREINNAGKILEDLKAEYDAQYAEHGGQSGRSAAVILTALGDRKEDLDQATEDFWVVKEKNTLEVYKIYYDAIAEYVEWFKDKDLDPEGKLDAKLKELDTKKDELETLLKERKPFMVLGKQVEAVAVVAEMARIGGELLP